MQSAHHNMRWCRHAMAVRAVAVQPFILQGFGLVWTKSWHPPCLNYTPMMRINDYFRLVVERNASDFHLSSGTRPMFRVGGVMTPVNDQILTNADVQALIGEILPP